ncbi:DUF3027 domain-containing protein [Citricoccus alkalitolerans]|uniref:DUF3027 domain-containing protein n=1 Tax=Citricoccus alkalitolerans TaxID=246603 RepID=A0ABV8XZD8_9MICC
MNLKPETSAPEDAWADPTAESPAAGETVQSEGRSVRIPPKPTRAPRRRTPKLDDLLAAAVPEARAALEGLAEDGDIGEHVGTVADDDRLVTHRFAASLSGYGGWEWFATLSRAPRSKVVTVCETGLLPGATAILAPDWLPWSERVSQEEKIRLDAIAAGEDPEKAVARARGEQQDQEAEPEDEGSAPQG